MRPSEARIPRFVRLLAYLLWSFPITYILLIGAFYNLPLAQIGSLFFTFYYFARSTFAVYTGVALFKMKPFAWHFYVFHSALMLFEQVYVRLRFAQNNVPEIPLALTILGTFVLLWALKAELRVPYFSPKIAWWESDPRYKISVPAQMTCSDHFYLGDIMDISASGCFIKTKDPLRVDQVVQIKFSLFDHKFDCNGRVVWRTESGVTHPKGVGVRFVDMDKAVQQDLRNTVKKLKSLSRKFKNLRAEEKAATMERKVQAMISQRKG